MSDMKDMIADTANKMFADMIDAEFLRGVEKGGSTETLWSTIEETGFTRVLNSEDKGGAAGDWEDAGALFFASGYHGVPLPLAETIVANHLMETAGMAIPEGITALSVDVKGTFSPTSLSAADHLLISRRGKLALYAAPDVHVDKGTNMAGEGRDRITELPDIPLATGDSDLDVFAIMAGVRSAQMAGAMARILDITVEYSGERQQFGKHISKFQAVQQQMATQGSEAAASQRAAENVFVQLVNSPDTALADIAAAKIRCGEAAEKVGRIGHGVHGAIGITEEYQLHLFTRRLWSWRSEFGNEGHWSTRLGEAAFEVGGAGLWAAITGNELRL